MQSRDRTNTPSPLRIDRDNATASSFDKMTDLEVWKIFCSGSDEALIFIYNGHVQRLFRFGLQFAPRETVKDAIQDLFVNLKEAKSAREIQRITPYLYKSLYRILQRKLFFFRKFNFQANEEIKNWEIQLSVESRLIDEEQSQERLGLLQKSLNELSVKQRKALLLYYYEGFTHNEIREIMNLSNKSSVRKLIYRAVEKLRAIVSAKGE
ncbi:MAG TPA: sigma-70 family RNA polymerase sigma factor [Cyclobacteriaceae bacterium]|nr:sigma-70 family RNA polymerase sigma factor [Cyclobacteriaceae bacterium]